MSTIDPLCTVHQQFDLLSSLKENERVHVKWKGYSKYQAPDRFLKDRKNSVLRGLHHVITLAIKILQAIGRIFTFQTRGKEVESLKELSKKTSEICEDFQLPTQPNADFYRRLNELGKIREVMQKTFQSETLETYQETLRTGNAQVFKGSEETREQYAKEVGEVVRDLKAKVAPQIDRVLDRIEDALFKQDKSKVVFAMDRYLKQGGRKSLAAEEKNYFTAKALRHVMYDTFGEETTEKALKRYGLDKARAITEKEMQIVMTGMLANLTFKDLESIYSNRSKELLPVSKRYKRMDKEFDQLNQVEVCAFMGDLCSIVHKKLRVSKDSPHLNQLRHDKILLNNLRLMNHYHPKNSSPKGTKDISRFAYTEYLSRYMTYALFNDDKANFPDGILIPVFDKSGKLALKEAHKVVSSKGLHCVVFKPAFVKEGERPDIQVAFRGTYCWQSMMRDFGVFESGFTGPGRKSFRASEDTIIEKIVKHVNDLNERSGEKVRVEFMGHSLGASDAQRGLEKFTNIIVRGEFEQDKISTLKLFAYNSPSIESDIGRRFISNVYKTPLNFKLRYFDADNDPVQGSGKVRLGYRSRNSHLPDNLFASCYRFNRDLDEKIEMMAANFFSRMNFWSKRASRAHSAPFLCGVYPKQASQKNTTFIDEVVTNHPKDSRMRFGEDLEVFAEKSSDEEVNEALRTPLWYLSRKFKRYKNNFFSLFFNKNTERGITPGEDVA